VTLAVTLRDTVTLRDMVTQGGYRRPVIASFALIALYQDFSTTQT